MRDNDLELIVSYISFGVIIGWFITFLITITSFTYNTTLIKQNHAYYHPQTGEFTLKECKE